MKILTYLKRPRLQFLWLGCLVAIGGSLLSDPDSGLSTLLGGLALVQGIVAVGLAHWARKALMDYPEANQQNLFRRASESATGAGLALIALAITFAALLMALAPRAHAAELPPGFYTHGPVLLAEQQRLWPAHADPAALAALVEQESCASLKSKSCWNPAARLKSAREEGAGMGQVTRAYRADGSLRFDSLAAARAKYSHELGDWSWSNAYTRPDLQLRAVVLMSMDAARPFAAAPAALHFGDAGYNGGVAGVQKERRACALSTGCDPGEWFGHVERHCLKSRQPLYAGRNACAINREHVHNVFLVRRAKYVAAMAAMRRAT